MTAPVLAIAERAIFVAMVAAVAIGLEAFGYSRLHGGGVVMLAAAFAAIAVTSSLASHRAFSHRLLCVLLAVLIVAGFAAANFAFLQWLRVERLHDLTPGDFAVFAGWYVWAAAAAIALTAGGAALAATRA